MHLPGIIPELANKAVHGHSMHDTAAVHRAYKLLHCGLALAANTAQHSTGGDSHIHHPTRARLLPWTWRAPSTSCLSP